MSQFVGQLSTNTGLVVRLSSPDSWQHVDISVPGKDSLLVHRNFPKEVNKVSIIIIISLLLTSQSSP